MVDGHAAGRHDNVNGSIFFYQLGIRRDESTLAFPCRSFRVAACLRRESRHAAVFRQRTPTAATGSRLPWIQRPVGAVLVPKHGLTVSVWLETQWDAKRAMSGPTYCWAIPSSYRRRRRNQDRPSIGCCSCSGRRSGFFCEPVDVIAGFLH